MGGRKTSARGLVAAAVAGVWLAGCAHGRAIERTPFPEIAADGSPGAVERGRQIFDGSCAACHQPPGAARAVGAPMHELPSFLGTIHAPNLTQHPAAGIGERTDAELARVIRYGVTRDGRRTLMGWGMSDDDVAAVLGFLRSGAPEVAADPTVQPPTQLSWIGRMVLPRVLGAPPPYPPRGLQAPPRSDPVAYGRYLALHVYDCGGCHSPGTSPDRARGEDAFTGGFEFVDSEHRKVYSRNLTFHASGLEGWSLRQFRRALRDGISARGEPLRAPMRRYRLMPDEELQALYAFLKSLPTRPSSVPRKARPSRPLLADTGADGAVQGTPAELFAALGCESCHRPGAQFHDRLRGAREKSAEELATWIRNPERFRPGTQMPTFEELIDFGQARALAEWIRAGNAERLAPVEP